MVAWIEVVLSGCTVLVVNSATKNADRKSVKSLEGTRPDKKGQS
jgi:hypothetical protein